MKKWIIGGIIGFFIGFLLLIYINYVPLNSECIDVPNCGTKETGVECCPTTGYFVCSGLVDSNPCNFFNYLLNIFSYVLAVPLALIGILIGFIISKFKK